MKFLATSSKMLCYGVMKQGHLWLGMEKTKKNNSKITHLLDGDISEGSTEAITGNQIYSLKNQFAAYFGGGASYGKKGKWIAPEFKVQAFNKVTLVSEDESDPVITDNVAAGRIEKGLIEAVNGDQLHDYTKKQTDMILDKVKEYTDEKVSNIVKEGVKEVHSYTEIKFAALSYTVEDI